MSDTVPGEPIGVDSRRREHLTALRDALLAGGLFFVLSTLWGRTSVVERAVLAVLLTLASLGFAELRARRARRAAPGVAADGAV
ncbi:hypothetical protein [Demequina activiva]|uniref:Uncharacterized protein n=1 Tax=Demequina activiva TaxID=1582364 RepID=A0A919Q463_9MICO|nr:hypothetical protein [Demequina activiva]GIG53973.1 hypothetical protein Dac01nite_07250 [Demequina activiva]